MTVPRRSATSTLSLLVLLPLPLATQELTRCPSDRFGARAECGSTAVPEVAGQQGRTIAIAFAVLRAEEAGAAAPVFMLAGGPGQGSTALAGLANGPLAAVRARRDIVLVDQRGTGGSNALACARDLELHPELAFGHVFAPERFSACRRALEARADLARYTTDQAVRDLDAVRERLGYDQVILWGGSYGTRLAQAYMRRFPGRVLAAVLDGVVPFDFGAPSTYAKTAQASLDLVLDDCAAQPRCHGAYPHLREDFGALRERLRAGPVPVQLTGRSGHVTVTLSAGDFAYAVRGLLYNGNGIRRLPAMIDRAARAGDLSEFAQAYWARAAGLQAGVAEGLHLTVFCSEDLPFVSSARARELATGTFFESYLWDEYAGACRVWTRGPIAADFRSPLESGIPTLLVSGRYDPVTPPTEAERVARHLTTVRHVVVPNEAHGAGFGCARPAVLHVLLTGTLEGLPDPCPGAGPIDLGPRG